MICLASSFYSDPSHTVTNAAGGLNNDYEVGDIVILNDVRLCQKAELGPLTFDSISILLVLRVLIHYEVLTKTFSAIAFPLYPMLMI